MSAEQKLAELLAGPTKPRGASDPEPTEELETVDHAEVQPQGHQGPSASRVVTVSNLFQHPESHPIILDLCLLRKYGHEWYGWEPETLELRIPQDFHVREVSDLCLSKIQACKTLHLVDTYWKQWEVFGWSTMSLNGVFPDFDVLQVPTVAQCMISAEISKQIRDDVGWSSEVTAYLEAVHRHDGIYISQSPLDFVHVDASSLTADLDQVRILWSTVRTSNKMPTGETVVAEQLRRMLTVHRALEESRLSLRAQLPLVQHV